MTRRPVIIERKPSPGGTLRRRLEHAFAVLLGKPLDTFAGGTYELWFWIDNDIHESTSELDEGGYWWQRYRVDETWDDARRAITDGTLFDAMAAATCSQSAPRHLLRRADADDMADSVVVHDVWATLLADIEDEVLREHIAMSCVDEETARWFGSYYVGNAYVSHALEVVQGRGRELVASWVVGEGQGGRAVFRIADSHTK